MYRFPKYCGDKDGRDELCYTLTKQELPKLVLDALHKLDGSATVVEVARHVWQDHETELRDSGHLFFTWRYDLRWAAQHLRNQGQLAPTSTGAASRWTLSH